MTLLGNISALLIVCLSNGLLLWWFKEMLYNKLVINVGLLVNLLYTIELVFFGHEQLIYNRTSFFGHEQLIYNRTSFLVMNNNCYIQ